MSFKNKMKNRGISKLDNLVETPDYITPVQRKKFSWNWLKIAIPVTAGLVLVVLPASILTGYFLGSNKSMSKSSEMSNDYASDPAFNYDSSASPEPTGYDTPGNTAESDAVSMKNESFANLLTNHNINGNYVIEVSDYADGYMEPTYAFEGEAALNIVNSLKSINSNYDTYATKLDTASRNTAGYIMGINHRLTFKDGQNEIVTYYYSQFSTLVVDASAFDLTGSEAYTIMDEHIEMDYNPSTDETIN